MTQGFGQAIFSLKNIGKKLSKRKQSRPISSHLYPTNLVNKRFIMLSEAFFFLLEIPSEQDRTILPVFVASKYNRICFIVPFQSCYSVTVNKNTCHIAGNPPVVLVPESAQLN